MLVIEIRLEKTALLMVQILVIVLNTGFTAGELTSLVAAAGQRRRRSIPLSTWPTIPLYGHRSQFYPLTAGCHGWMAQAAMFCPPALVLPFFIRFIDDLNIVAKGPVVDSSETDNNIAMPIIIPSWRSIGTQPRYNLLGVDRVATIPGLLTGVGQRITNMPSSVKDIWNRTTAFTF
ncbi:hypothetical protein C8Q75DRAFT_258298 [Abortiporus biennis]|nr:hypothetical protein C8Q75DRAFT_258298 [Abortiporus biennis]